MVPTEVTSASDDLVVLCELAKDALRLFCRASNYEPNSRLEWTSNGTTGWGSGSEWEFTLGDGGFRVPALTHVVLEECVGAVCRSTEVEVDTSAHWSGEPTDAQSTGSPTGEGATSSPPAYLGRLFQLPIDPYELAVEEAVVRFGGYGASSAATGTDASPSNRWEFIGTPGASVYAPSTGNVLKVEAGADGTRTVHLAGAVDDSDWVWEIGPIAGLAVGEGERVEAAERIGVIGDGGRLFLGLLEQSASEEQQPHLPRYHCPLISVHPAGFVQTQLEMIRRDDAIRLGAEQVPPEEWTPCLSAMPLPATPGAVAEVGASQLQIDQALAATAVWDPEPKPVPASFFTPSIAGLVVQFPVDPAEVIAHISTLSSHNPDWGKDVFHTFGHKRELLDEPGKRTMPDGSVVPATRFLGYDVNWYFLTPPGTPVFAPLAGRVWDVKRIHAGEPDMSLMINQSGGHDWAWNIDHVMNVQVADGDWVEPGDQIGEAAPNVGWTLEPSFASSSGFSIGLLEMTTGEIGALHHCPLIGFDPSGSALAELEQIQQALGDHYGISPDSHARWRTCISDQPIGGDRWSGSISVVLDYAGIAANP